MVSNGRWMLVIVAVLGCAEIHAQAQEVELVVEDFLDQRSAKLHCADGLGCQDPEGTQCVWRTDDEPPEPIPPGIDVCPGYIWGDSGKVFLQSDSYASRPARQGVPDRAAEYEAKGGLDVLWELPGYDPSTAKITVRYNYQSDGDGADEATMILKVGDREIEPDDFDRALVAEGENEKEFTLANADIDPSEGPEIIICYDDPDNQNNLRGGAFEILAIRVEFEPLEGEPFIRGDANSDGRVDLADPVYSLNAMFRAGPALACDRAGDANANGRLDVGDVMVVAYYLFRMGPSPVAPGPVRCGVARDPDSASLDCARYDHCAS